MYCGACARDVGLVLGLRARGHDVSVVPLYTPLQVDGDEPVPIEPVFLGGINLYLQQRSPLFRRIPASLDRFLDNASLLRFVSRFAVNTRASRLGEMAVATLRGAEGHLRKEFRRLHDHLERQAPPDVIVITNTMLLGLAPELKRRLSAPIICQVQGEDGFVGAMAEPHSGQAQQLIREHAQHVSLFVAPNHEYAGRMARYLDVPESDMRVVKMGVPADAYADSGPRHREPFTIGYLSGIAEGKGLDLLVEAWRVLAEKQGRDARLRVAGRVLDRAFWRKVTRSVRASDHAERFEYVGELELQDKVRFLQRCSAFSVPSRYPEVRGLAVMEAMAAGVPVVVPDAGVYPEMLSLTAGGLLFPPEDVDELAAHLAHLMDDADEADRLGREGAAGVAQHHSMEQSVDGMAAALEEALAR
jgi:glycosyltransferase involved in cell wall biosynthesis